MPGWNIMGGTGGVSKADEASDTLFPEAQMLDI